MSSIGTLGNHIGVSAPAREPLVRSAATSLHVGTLVVAAGIVIGLRIWGLNATFATSDQAAMAWMLRYSFGIEWIFAHDYGPVLPVIMRTWTEVLNTLGIGVNEAAIRLPIVGMSLLQVLVTFGLLRRLNASARVAGVGCLVAGVLPLVVTDSHYSWAYTTCWLLTGSTALWATLAFFDTGRLRWLLIAGAALLLHCLSNCYAFALPISLLAAWWQERHSGRGLRWRSWLAGCVLPCTLALIAVLLCWHETGAGQIGRLLVKQHGGATGLHIGQSARLPHIWTLQFGYLFALPAAAGLTYGTLSNDRRRPLAVWAWASLLPIVLAIDWTTVGYVSAYLAEAAYAGGLLGVLWIASTRERLAHRPRLRTAFTCAAAVAVVHMAAGSADAALRDGKLAALTGVRTGWGSIKPESGIKAAGWYIRRHVPDDAIIMTTHTNQGLEAPVARYYLGRAVLASYDLKPAMVEPLVRAMEGCLDVLIVEASRAPLADRLNNFECVAIFRRNGEPVRCVYARPGLHLPHVDAEAANAAAWYDRHCPAGPAPQPIVTPPELETHLAYYQITERRLRLAHRRSTIDTH